MLKSTILTLVLSFVLATSALAGQTPTAKSGCCDKGKCVAACCKGDCSKCKKCKDAKCCKNGKCTAACKCCKDGKCGKDCCKGDACKGGCCGKK